MVQLSCGVQCTRASLFALNIVFLLIGFSVMGLGIFVKVNGNFSAISEIHSFTEAFGNDLMQWIGVGLIVIGIFTACLATFGCLGAVLKHRCLLYVYATFLILIIVFEFAVVILTLVVRKDMWNTYDSGFLEIFNHAYSQNRTEAKKLIENLEHKFQCCGVNGPSDYTFHGYEIPPSCHPAHSTMVYADGCAEAVVLWLWNKLPIIAGVLGSILFIEIFAVISSLILGVAITHSSKVEDYQKF